jgi:HK97 family phage prohead protease
MPWHTARSADCPPAKPWAVILDADGSKVACHATEADAKRHVAALYANTDEPGMRGAVTETMYRTFRPELQVRSQGDGRTIFGIAVPYGAPTRINERLVEQFARGAFNHQLRAANRVKFAREHMALGGSLIGAATLLRDDPAGLYGEFRVSKTPLGDETLELVRDGALSHLSVGFTERENRKLAGGVTERVKADLGEVAVVLQGAYGDLAASVGVRSSQGTGLVPAEEVELRARAEEFLVASALPDPPDYELNIRAIRLGLHY